MGTIVIEVNPSKLDKIAAEAARVGAEIAKDEAETARVGAEVAKEGAETAQLGANIARAEAEALALQNYTGIMRVADVISKGPIIDVRAFGVVGDGITDDTNIIQAAFNTVSDNSTVIFPKGTYSIRKNPGGGTTKISISKSNLHIIGYGAVIQADVRSVFCFALSLAEGRLSNIVIEGFTFIDNDPNAHYEAPYEETHGISANGVDGLKILNCTFKNLGDEALDIYNCTDFEVSGCIFDNVPSLSAAGGAIGINGSSNGTIHNNIVKNSTHGFGVHLEAKPDSHVRCVSICENIFKSVQYGVYINSSGGEVTDIDIKNNIFKDNAINAIGGAGASIKDNIDISFNKIYGGGTTNSAISLFVTTTTCNVISNNVIKNWGTGDTSYGINGYNCKISNNNLINIYNSGINAENSMINGNRVVNCGLLSGGNRSGIINTSGFAEGNEVSNCYIGIRLAGVSSKAVSNNIIGCTTPVIAGGSTPVVINTPV